MVWGWCGDGVEGVEWCGDGVEVGGVGFVPVMVWVLNVFGRLLRPGLCWCLLESREELNTTLQQLDYTASRTTLAASVESPGLVAIGRWAE